MNTLKQRSLCAEIIKLYGIHKSPSASDVTKLQVMKSHVYGMQTVYRFTIMDKTFYISDDYSLMDSPAYMRQVIEEFEPKLKGRLLRNPVPQSDGAIYARGFAGTEYYLWECA